VELWGFGILMDFNGEVLFGTLFKKSNLKFLIGNFSL
jgi:hypothetical protein